MHIEIDIPNINIIHTTWTSLVCSMDSTSHMLSSCGLFVRPGSKLGGSVVFLLKTRVPNGRCR